MSCNIGETRTTVRPPLRRARGGRLHGSVVSRKAPAMRSSRGSATSFRFFRHSQCTSGCWTYMTCNSHKTCFAAKIAKDKHIGRFCWSLNQDHRRQGKKELNRRATSQPSPGARHRQSTSAHHRTPKNQSNIEIFTQFDSLYYRLCSC